MLHNCAIPRLCFPMTKIFEFLAKKNFVTPVAGSELRGRKVKISPEGRGKTGERGKKMCTLLAQK